MTTLQKLLFFIILPIVAILMYPPSFILSGLPVISVVAILYILLGVLIWRGRSLALTFAIFTQGLNVIVRLMMFFSNSFSKTGEPAFDYLGLTLLAMVLSMYLLLRLDKNDVRLMMIK